MRGSFISAPTKKQVNPSTTSSAMHDRLSLALESSRQIAFDWFISDDRLYFSGEPAAGLKAILLDTTRTWSSQALPSFIHEDDQENFRKCLREALKGTGYGDGAFHNVELRLKDASLCWRWVAISGKIVERDSHGRAVRMVGMFSDIEERKHAERKSTRLRDLYIALSQTNQAIVRINDHDELFEEVCRIIVEHGHFRMAWISVIQHDKQQAMAVAAYASSNDKSRSVTRLLEEFDLNNESIVEAALRESKFKVCNNASVTSYSADSRKTAVQSDLQSLACFPFKLSGRPYGVLTICSADKDCFDSQLIRLLEELAGSISLAIDNYARESRRKSIEAALVDSEKFKSAILTASLDCIVSINHLGEIISFNEAAEATFGYCSDDVLGKKLADIIIPQAWRELHRLGIERFLATGTSSLLNRRLELTAMRADGSTLPVELAVVPLSVQNDPVFTAFIRDISERKHAETLQLGQNRILNMVATGVPLQEILTEIARFAENQSGRGLCSIQQLNDEGNTLFGRIAPNLPPSCMAQLDDSEVGPSNGSCGTAVFRGEPVTVTDIASDPLWAEQRDLVLQHGLKACTSWPIFGRNRKILGTFALYFREATAPTAKDLQLFEICTNLAGIAIESRASEEKIRYLAHYDGLTSLPNRFLFKEYLEMALGNARRHGKKFAVFFLDLDKFKEINDTLGHDAGDKVLREIAKRLRTSLRHTDKIARMGGDEFYVLIEELSDGRYAADVAQKLLGEASRPVRIGDQECRLSVSIGISVFPNDGNDGQTLLKNADSAMYRAKDKGKNGYEFHSSIDEPAENRMPVLAHHLRARLPDADAMRVS
ncbi:diguanylate cyclase [Noviherbaspirillum sp.]|uniref:sensor domain-containing diguanylate cyclase n=1 Tax=Noviherbaspirillum sp. TaxID=1926288 RepID=UPI0025DB455F|nr:diguanylate cyclase [Noviherbaspirillum sp.]